LKTHPSDPGRTPRPGFTLIELMVVIAVIAVLYGMILPAVSTAREAARRAHCLNNLRQIGLGLNAYHASNGSFPVGFLYPSGPIPAETSPQQYRWSVLTQLAPFLDQIPVYNAFNFNLPLAHRPAAGNAPLWPYYPANATAMAVTVGTFLCPSDSGNPPAADSGPVNYVFCTGSGVNGGDAAGADGVFLLGPAVTYAGITDGSSSTVAASEQVVGLPGPYSQTTPTPRPSFLPRAFARVAATPLTDTDCANAPRGWLFNKGAAWWDGNYLNTLYNHHAPPNAPAADCVTYHNPGWKAARSLHPGGINTLYCDGSVRFSRNTVDPATWRALATRAGKELFWDDTY